VVPIVNANRARNILTGPAYSECKGGNNEALLANGNVDSTCRYRWARGYGEGQRAGAGAARFSVIGVIDGPTPDTTTVLDIVVAVPAGQDEQTAVDAALKAVGARAPEPRDFPLAFQPFVLNGITWPQFFDKNKRNNLVTFLYNPTGDPTGGAALASFQNAEATWSDVRGSSFNYAFGGQTTLGPAFDRINTISWANQGIPCNIFGITTSTFSIVTGELLDADIVLNSTSTCGFSWRTDGGDIDVQTIALHELGHALGFGHSPDPSSIMFAFYEGARRALDVIDVDGLIFLYPAHTSNAVTPRSASVPFRLVAALGDLAPGGFFSSQGWNSRWAT